MERNLEIAPSLSFFLFFFMLFCFKFVVNDNPLPTFQTVIFRSNNHVEV